MIIVISIIAALACYLMGFAIGKWYAEEQFRMQRDELGLYSEPEDAWDELFKE